MINPKHGILLVRHPLIRLYSAWAHRLSDSQPHHKRFFARQIKYINKYHQKKSDKPIPRHLHVSFPAFLRFVSTERAHQRPMQDVHWWRIEKRCHVCELVDYYEFIVKTETANQDCEVFLQNIRKNWTGKLLGAYTKNKSSGKSLGPVKQTSDIQKHIEDIQKYYREEISANIVKSVYQRYQWDFKFFGYDLDGFLK